MGNVDSKRQQVFEACEAGDLQQVKTILNSAGFTGDDFNDDMDVKGRTPLTCAALSNTGETRELIDFLIDELGVGVDGGARGPGTALYLACRKGDAELARHLLARGADPNLGAADGTPPLVVCAATGQMEAAEALLGARRPGAAAAGGAGFGANMYPGVEAALGYAVVPYVRVEGCGRDGRGPLLAAAAAGDLPLARLLLAHGASPVAVDADGATALHLAAAAAYPPDGPVTAADLLEVLLDAAAAAAGGGGGGGGGDLLGARDGAGRTALARAAAAGRAPAAAWLLARGADPLALGWDGAAPLALAAAAGSHATAKALLDAAGKEGAAGARGAQAGADLPTFFLARPRDLCPAAFQQSGAGASLEDHVDLTSVFGPKNKAPRTPSPAPARAGERGGAAAAAADPSTLDGLLAGAGGTHARAPRVVGLKGYLAAAAAAGADLRRVRLWPVPAFARARRLLPFTEAQPQLVPADQVPLDSAAVLAVAVAAPPPGRPLDPTGALAAKLGNYLAHHAQREGFAFDYLWLEPTCCPPAEALERFEHGDAVEARFMGAEWRPAVVAQQDMDGRCTLDYEHGAREVAVPHAFLRWPRGPAVANLPTALLLASALLVLTNVSTLPLAPRPPPPPGASAKKKKPALGGIPTTAEVTDLVATLQDPMVLAQLLLALLHDGVKTVVSFRCGHHDHFEAWPRLGATRAKGGAFPLADGGVGLAQVLRRAFEEAERDQETVRAAVPRDATLRNPDLGGGGGGGGLAGFLTSLRAPPKSSRAGAAAAGDPTRPPSTPARGGGGGGAPPPAPPGSAASAAPPGASPRRPLALPRPEDAVVVESVFNIFNRATVESLWMAPEPTKALRALARAGTARAAAAAAAAGSAEEAGEEVALLEEAVRAALGGGGGGARAREAAAAALAGAEYLAAPYARALAQLPAAARGHPSPVGQLVPGGGGAGSQRATVAVGGGGGALLAAGAGAAAGETPRPPPEEKKLSPTTLRENTATQKRDAVQEEEEGESRQESQTLPASKQQGEERKEADQTTPPRQPQQQKEGAAQQQQQQQHHHQQQQAPVADGKKGCNCLIM